MSAELFLSPLAGTPMYQQIVDQITAKVVAGDWLPGHALPSIRELAASSQVSVITVKRAYQELEHAGVIVTSVGKGSFVAASNELPRALLHKDLIEQLQAVMQLAARLGLTPDELKALLDEQASATTSSLQRNPK